MVETFITVVLSFLDYGVFSDVMRDGNKVLFSPRAATLIERLILIPPSLHAEKVLLQYSGWFPKVTLAPVYNAEGEYISSCIVNLPRRKEKIWVDGEGPMQVRSAPASIGIFNLGILIKCSTRI
jgi:hypothetical protein